MNPAPATPRLWVTAARAAQVRALLAAGEPTAVALAALVQRHAALPHPDRGDLEALSDHVTAAITGHLLSGDPALARQAVDTLLVGADLTAGNLGRGHLALTAAAAMDACAPALDDERTLALADLLLRLARSFRTADLAHGDPHIITNNHWAVSHSGAALAAMAIHGRAADRAGHVYDLREDIAWARGRVRPFLMHHGDQGLYHEGLGYQLYPASYWLPLLLASPNFDGVDWLADFPHLRQAPAALYATVATRPADTGRCGVKLVWNDDGAEWSQANAATLLLALAPPAQVGALRWLYDRLNGVHGDAQFAPRFCGWFFTLLYYPFAAPPVHPQGVLPAHLTDSRQGLSLWRPRYHDAADTILGAYARVTHVGGHAQDDAGSLRLMALGHDWIVGGGQNRGQAEFQSRALPCNWPPPKPSACGAVIWDEATSAGGVFGMDLRRACGCYAERWLALDTSGRAGVPVLLALLDVADEHLQRDWQWHLSFGADLHWAADPDGAGFTLAAADGAQLHARFLGTAPTALRLCRMPDSQRRYQGGAVRDYPGGPYVQAQFASRPHLAIYVVIAISRAPLPSLTATAGLDIQIGASTWSRPFGAAIPATYTLAEGGTLCRYPTGWHGD